MTTLRGKVSLFCPKKFSYPTWCSSSPGIQLNDFKLFGKNQVAKDPAAGAKLFGLHESFLPYFFDISQINKNDQGVRYR